ncbi:MAG: hypothetical protein COW08_04480 [Ignavibacteriales bacterium CG12_big_fil_rev_8_21_14_0_65_30_8]|nr:MAG: hypothetical protein COW08_04480 [Ignavibacteriales bacterium CG12_big_fil_rev_8_21_14_0_65_30_8]
MGKVILILSIGFSIITSILIINLNKNSDLGLDETINSFKKTQARLIANSSIEIYLEKLRRDKDLFGKFSDNDLMGGSYDINIYGVDTLLTIKSVSHFQDVNHTTIVTSRRDGIILPNVNSAVRVSSSNISLNLNGNIDINGFDHDINGSEIPGTDLPGIGVDSPADSTFIVDNLKSKISNAIEGEGGPPSVKVVEDTTNWLKLTQNLIFAADITIPSGTYSSGSVFGTFSEPKITYASGDIHFTGSAYGYGILIVNGNLDMSGNFTFHGIVITYGQSSIETKTTGNSGIIGSSIFVGNSVDMQATGNAKLYYSSQAINNINIKIKSSRFKILSWWE